MQIKDLLQIKDKANNYIKELEKEKNQEELEKKNQEENAINELEKLFIDLNMPMNFANLGIAEPNIGKMIDLLTDNGKKSIAHHSKPMDKEVAQIIFDNCKTYGMEC